MIHLEVKKEVNITVLTDKFFGDELPIDDLTSLVSSAIEKGATHFTIDTEYDSGRVDATFFYTRLETDEEFSARLLAKQKSKEHQDEIDKRLYETLRKKFEQK